MDRKEKIVRYTQYKHRILMDDILSPKEQMEYKALERELMRSERPSVVETEAHKEEMSSVPEMNNGTKAAVYTPPKSDEPFVPVIKTDADFKKVPHDELVSASTHTYDDTPFTPKIIRGADAIDLDKMRREIEEERTNPDFHVPTEKTSIPRKDLSSLLGDIYPKGTAVIDDSKDLDGLPRSGILVHDLNTVPAQDGLNLSFHDPSRDDDMTRRRPSKLDYISSNEYMDSNKVLELEDPDNFLGSIAHGGATLEAQAHMLNLPLADYMYIKLLNIDGVYYGTKIFRAIQARREKGEEYMDIVEAAKAKDVDGLNKLLSSGNTKA